MGIFLITWGNKSRSRIMKCVVAILLLASVATVFSDLTVPNMVWNEVHAIINANSGISSADCRAKCDSMFQLLQNGDERGTDRLCRQQCACQTDSSKDYQKDCKPTAA